jgi:hypothetical protein
MIRGKPLAWVLVALLAVPAAARLWREYLPRGASPQPYLLASRDGPRVASPDGAVTLQVVFNDAGALHSGNHWTWLVASSPLWGRWVAAQGYLGDASVVGVNGVRDPLPLRWLDDRTLEVEFRTGRRTTATARQRVAF